MTSWNDRIQVIGVGFSPAVEEEIKVAILERIKGEDKGRVMNTLVKVKGSRVKALTILRERESGEIVGECELTPARVRAIVRAYALAGVIVEEEGE